MKGISSRLAAASDAVSIIAVIVGSELIGNTIGYACRSHREGFGCWRGLSPATRFSGRSAPCCSATVEPAAQSVPQRRDYAADMTLGEL